MTYVRIGNIWNYICVLIDLFNREIISYSVERNKDAVLVSKAFSSVNANLSMKDCPYDNAVAEATLNIIKTEFVKGQEYESLEELQYKLSDYVNWFINHKIHPSWGLFDSEGIPPH